MDTEVLKDPPPGVLQKLLRIRKLWLLVLLIGAYFLLLFVLPRLIDSRTLRRDLEETTSAIIGADVTIGQVEIEIRPLGGWRVRLRDIIIENSSPDFKGNLFTCRKVVFKGSFADLFAGKWKPEILFKNWILRIHLLPDGSSNISDLFLPQGSAPQAYRAWPFSEIMMAEQKFRLQNGKLLLVNGTGGGLIHETGLLQGEGTYTPGKSTGGISGELQFNLGGATLNKGSGGKRLEATLAVTDFAASADEFKGNWTLGLAGEGVPLEVVLRLLRLPPMPANGEAVAGKARVKGLFGADRSAWLSTADILVNLKGNSLPLFDMVGPLRITYMRGDNLKADRAGAGGIRRDELTFAEAGVENPKTAAVTCLTDAGGMVRELGITASDFNFSRIPKKGEPNPWSAKFLSRLRKVTARVDAFKMLGFTVNKARTITEIEDGSIAKMAMTGGFCKGEISFGTGGWPLGDTGWPRAVGVTVRNVEANGFLEAISHLLPAPAVFSPSEGRLYCTLFHIPEATDAALVLQEKLLRELNMNLVAPEAVGAHKGWDGTLLVKELRFDEHGGNPVLKALWELPCKLAAVQAACGGAETPVLADKPVAGGAGEKPKGKAKPLTSLRVTEGSLRAVREDSGGALKLDGGFITREFGRVMIAGETLPDEKSFRLRVRVYPFESGKEDNDTRALPALAPAFLAAAKAVGKKNGLLLTFDISGKEIKLTENYMTEIAQAYAELNRRQPAPPADNPEKTPGKPPLISPPRKQ